VRRVCAPKASTAEVLLVLEVVANDAVTVASSDGLHVNYDGALLVSRRHHGRVAAVRGVLLEGYGRIGPIVLLLLLLLHARRIRSSPCCVHLCFHPPPPPTCSRSSSRSATHPTPSCW
jgi:hypothetical protein